jgi:hypothetical protein
MRLSGDSRRYMQFHDFMRLLHTGLKKKRLLPGGVSEDDLCVLLG